MRNTILFSTLGFALALPVAALERGEVTLEPCRLDASGTPRRVEAFCARTEVPEDHAAPDGRKIELRFAVLPAVRRDPQPDPLLLLAGGPGQASTEAFLGTVRTLERVRRERDLVMIDQRGTGRLSLLRCDEGSESSFDVDADALEDLMQACLEQVEDVTDPKAYTTTASVLDMDLIRQRLGYETVNLYGISYGSRLAQAYARQFPEHVRAIVVDGIAPLDLNLAVSFGDDTQRALDALFARCEADETCRETLPDLASRLNEFLAGLEEQPQAMSVSHPRTGEPVDFEFTREFAGQALRLLLYSPETAALIPVLVDRAAAGHVSRLAAQWMMVAESLGSSINTPMSLSVNCAEDAAFYDPAALDAAATAGFLRDDVPRHLQRACRVWPHKEVPAEEKLPLTSDLPTLILSGENDPVTPPYLGEQLLATMSNARHLVVPGMGHGVLERGCMPKLVTEFLAEPDPAGLDATCIEKVEPLPIFL
ncbi:MAG: alpha/beta hydrolase, partial [Acidobacteriota bacterium]